MLHQSRQYTNVVVAKDADALYQELSRFVEDKHAGELDHAVQFESFIFLNDSTGNYDCHLEYAVFDLQRGGQVDSWTLTWLTRPSFDPLLDRLRLHDMPVLEGLPAGLRAGKYTVLLLLPDYMAETFGHDTYLSHVSAADAEAAVATAKKVAAEEFSVDDGDDFHVLLVAAGWVEDLAPQEA